MSTLKANKDKARFISNPISQDALDGDWVDHEVITKYKLPEITIDAETTTGWIDGSNEKLVTDTAVAENDKVRLYDGISVVDGSLGITTTITGSLVSSTDPFSDGRLISKHTFDANSLAQSVGVSTLTAFAGTPSYGTGVFGSCLTPNGSQTYVSSINYTGGTDVKSISFFFKITDVTVSQQLCNATEGSNYWYFEKVSTGPNVRLVAWAGSYAVSAEVPVSNNTWYHAVIVANGATFTLYIDGVDKGSIVKNTGAITSRIFFSGNNGSPAHNGSLDQVEIYDRVLTPTEVSTLYTQTATTVKYSADILSFGLSTPPTKAFFNKTIDTTLSAEATGKCKSSTITQIGVL